jgi:ABC-type Na+ efflux pump permease subunit
MKLERILDEARQRAEVQSNLFPFMLLFFLFFIFIFIYFNLLFILIYYLFKYIIYLNLLFI